VPARVAGLLLSHFVIMFRIFSSLVDPYLASAVLQYHSLQACMRYRSFHHSHMVQANVLQLFWLCSAACLPADGSHVHHLASRGCCLVWQAGGGA
jgi:hypothetical protein